MGKQTKDSVRSYVLSRIDKDPCEYASSDFVNLTTSGTRTSRNESTTEHGKKISSSEAELNKICNNGEWRDNHNSKLSPEKESTGRVVRHFVNNGEYCDNTSRLYNYDLNNSDMIREEQANKVCNCGTSFSKYDDGQHDQQTFEQSLLDSDLQQAERNGLNSLTKQIGEENEKSSISPYCTSKLPLDNSNCNKGQHDVLCLKCYQSKIISLTESCADSNTLDSICRKEADPQIESNDLDTVIYTKVYQSQDKSCPVPSLRRRSFNDCETVESFRKANLDSAAKILDTSYQFEKSKRLIDLVSPKLHKTADVSKKVSEQKPSKSLALINAWRNSFIPLRKHSLPAHPNERREECSLKLGKNTEFSQAKTMETERFRRKQSIYKNFPEESDTKPKDEQLNVSFPKPKIEEQSRLEKIKEFKQKELLFSESTKSNSDTDEQISSDVQFKTISYSDSISHQFQETKKSSSSDVWSPNTTESEFSRGYAESKGNFQRENLWTLNNFSKDVIPTPPPSAMKKRRSIGNEFRKPKVKFDLDVEVYVVPRDSHQPSPTDFSTSDQEDVDAFVNNFDDDTDDSFSLLSLNSDKEVLGDYIPPDVSGDIAEMRNEFGKLSVNGSLAPFRVIKRDESPSSARTITVLPAAVYTGRRNSLDLIQMQQFLKQQAKERALSSSSSSRLSTSGQVVNQNSSKNSKQPLDAPSIAGISNYWRNSPSNSRQIKTSSAYNNGRIPRYAHLQLQRQYENWEDRRKTKKRLLDEQPGNKQPEADSSSLNVEHFHNRLKRTSDNQKLSAPQGHMIKHFPNASGTNASANPLHLQNRVAAAFNNRTQSAAASFSKQVSSHSQNHDSNRMIGSQAKRSRKSMPTLLRSGVLVSTAAHTLSFARRSLRADNSSSKTRPSTTEVGRMKSRQILLEWEQQPNRSLRKDFLSEKGENFNFAKLSKGARSTLKDAHTPLHNTDDNMDRAFVEMGNANYKHQNHNTLLRNARQNRKTLPSQPAVTLKTLGVTVHPPRTSRQPTMGCIQLKKDNENAAEINRLRKMKRGVFKSLASPRGSAMQPLMKEPEKSFATREEQNQERKSFESLQLTTGTLKIADHENELSSSQHLAPEVVA